MAAHDVIMPKMGMYMEDIRLVEWLSNEGAQVAAGDLLFTLETDKVTSDVEAEAGGFLHQVVAADSLVAIGGVVGAIAASREEYEALVATPAAGEFEPAQSELFLNYIRSADESGGALVPAEPVRSEPASRPAAQGAKKLVSPRARALIAEAGLSAEVVETIPASGPEGRLTDKDVKAFLEPQMAAPPAEARAPAGPLVEIAVAERVPLRGRRRVIARRMMESLQTTAQLTSILEIDVGGLVEWRARTETRPGYTAIFLALVAQALRRHPIVNSRLTETEIELLADVNVAFAVNTDDSVLAPVIRGADVLSLGEIDAQLASLTERARSGTITLEELDGGTFTLSNSGAAPVDITTAIINPPQAAILWLGRIRERPVVIEGAVCVRPTVQACLTYDHRVIDGVPAAEFLGTLEELIRSVPDSIEAR